MLAIACDNRNLNSNYDTTANNNRFVNTFQAVGGVLYDVSGNILNDGVNQYLYDGDGRICATSTTVLGTTTMTGYIYNAEGIRVAKGTITAMSCDPGASGFTATHDYILGLAGQQGRRIS